MWNTLPTKDAKANMRWKCRSCLKTQVHEEGTENSLFYLHDLIYKVSYQSDIDLSFVILWRAQSKTVLWNSVFQLFVCDCILQFYNLNDTTRTIISVIVFMALCPFGISAVAVIFKSSLVLYVLSFLYENILLEILIICVKPHSLFISVSWISNLFFPFYF